MPARRSWLSLVLAFIAAACAVSGTALLLPPLHRSARRADAPATAARATPSAPAPTLADVPATAPADLPDEVPFAPDLATVPAPGRPDRIVIPSIQLDSKVVSVGVTRQNGKPEWETAAFAVGFYRGTALPGTRGNAVLAGHISSPVSHKGDVFRHLPQVRIGDMIDVFSGEQRVRFTVAEIHLVPPGALAVMAPTAAPTLTLLTCYPDGVYSERLVVIGKPVEEQD